MRTVGDAGPYKIFVGDDDHIVLLQNIMRADVGIRPYDYFN